jgi:hypothetical protein
MTPQDYLKFLKWLKQYNIILVKQSAYDADLESTPYYEPITNQRHLANKYVKEQNKSNNKSKVIL